MKDNDFIFINSTVGSLILLFLSIVAFPVFGPEPLWLPVQGGGEYFNPRCLSLLLILIPIGALLGCLASVKQQPQHISWISCALNWLLSCILSVIVLFQTVFLLSVLHPLLVCGLGLAFTLFLFWAARRTEKSKPSYVKLPM